LKNTSKPVPGANLRPVIFDFRSQCKWRGKAVAPTRHAGIEMKAEALAKADVFKLGEVLLRATRRAQDQEMAFTYVYILHSERDPRRFYTGCAHDLRDRLNRHNSGKILHRPLAELLQKGICNPPLL